MKTRCLPTFPARFLGILLTLVIGLAAGGAAYGQVTDGVRVIDIKYILEHHTRFRGQMASLKKEFDDTAKRIQEERQAIMDLEKGLNQYVPGSPDYKALDESIATKKAQWALQTDRQRRDFRTRESDILWQVYYEIQSAVKTYSERNNVALVIQFNGDQPDPKQADGVAKAMGRNIFFAAPNRDITPIILEVVNRGDAAAARPAPPGVPPRQ